MSEEKYSVYVENQEELEEVLEYEDAVLLVPSSEYYYPTDLTILGDGYSFGVDSAHYDNIQAWREAV